MNAPTHLKIVVPINFAKPEGLEAPPVTLKSTLALRFALSHAGGTGEIFLFHVLEHSSSDFRQLDHLNEEVVQLMKMAILTTTNELRGQGIACDIAEVHQRISHGKPVAEIMQMATGVDADMIVMGAPRSRAFHRFIDKAPCTVVLTKDKFEL